MAPGSNIIVVMLLCKCIIRTSCLSVSIRKNLKEVVFETGEVLIRVRLTVPLVNKGEFMRIQK